MKRLIFLIAMFVLPVMMAEAKSFGEGYDEFRPYGYQRMWRWEQIRKSYGGGVEYRDSLVASLQKRKHDYLICPWWFEDLYCDPFVASLCRRGIGYVGYVLDPVSGMPELTNEWYNDSRDCILNDSIYRGIPFDLVVYCRNGEAFDRFLRSNASRLRFLSQVFQWPDGMINKKHLGKKPRGINFYLPDLSFHEKREFIQFIRSVSMIIDSLCVDGGNLPYTGDNCMLSVTLPTSAKDEVDYLSGVTTYVDDIYFIDYDRYGVPVDFGGILNQKNDPAMLLTKLLNQFYLFNLSNKSNKSKPEQICNCDINALAQMDYDIFQWKYYFFIDIGLVMGLIALIVLYNLHSPFYMFVDRNRWMVTPVIITFVTEAIIVFLFMLEAMSKDRLLFDMNDSGHFWLLALPVVFILLNVLMRLIDERKTLP